MLLRLWYCSLSVFGAFSHAGTFSLPSTASQETFLMAHEIYGILQGSKVGIVLKAGPSINNDSVLTTKEEKIFRLSP